MASTAAPAALLACVQPALPTAEADTYTARLEVATPCAADSVDRHYWRFQCGLNLVTAVKRDDIATVKRLHGRCPKLLPYAAMVEAARLGNLLMLQWLVERHKPLRLPEVLDAAASAGQLATVRWLRDQHYSFTRDAISGAMLGGHYEILALLHEVNYGYVVSECIHVDAWEVFESGDTRIPQLLLGDKYYGMDVNSGLLFSLERGDLPMAEWCRGTGRAHGLGAMDAAACSGQLQVVLWCHQFFPKSCTTRAMDDAAAKGYLPIVQWLHTNRTEGCTMWAMDGAASGGHWDVVQWLHCHRKEGCTTAAMDGAAAIGHLEMLAWLHVHLTEGCTTSAMDEAATNDHLDVVRWLHEHRNEGCTTQAMDGAASSGHLDVILWLHANRTEGCTTAAMDNAATNGQLEMLEWLHANRTEGCTTQAMDGAAEMGRLEIVQWLHINRSEGCTTSAIDSAAEMGHLETIQWLHQVRSEGCTKRAMRGAVDQGRLDIVLYLHSIGRPNCEVPMDREACPRLAQFEIVLWLFETDPHFASTCLKASRPYYEYASELLTRHLGKKERCEFLHCERELRRRRSRTLRSYPSCCCCSLSDEA